MTNITRRSMLAAISLGGLAGLVPTAQAKPQAAAATELKGAEYFDVVVAGGGAERVTFGSNYAISPAVNHDGTKLAYISRIESKFRVAVMDLATGQDLLVTTTERDESPSFAPNGRFLVYATEENGRGVLGTCSADARLSTRLTGEGNIREPAWGPILQDAAVNQQ